MIPIKRRFPHWLGFHVLKLLALLVACVGLSSCAVWPIPGEKPGDEGFAQQVQNIEKKKKKRLDSHPRLTRAHQRCQHRHQQALTWLIAHQACAT